MGNAISRHSPFKTSCRILSSLNYLPTSCVHACSVAKSCLTLCDPLDCSLPASSVHGIFQARVLEWVAISCSWGSSWPRDWTYVSCIGRFFPWGKPQNVPFTQTFTISIVFSSFLKDILARYGFCIDSHFLLAPWKYCATSGLHMFSD